MFALKCTKRRGVSLKVLGRRVSFYASNYRTHAFADDLAPTLWFLFIYAMGTLAGATVTVLRTRTTGFYCLQRTGQPGRPHIGRKRIHRRVQGVTKVHRGLLPAKYNVELFRFLKGHLLSCIYPSVLFILINGHESDSMPPSPGNLHWSIAPIDFLLNQLFLAAHCYSFAQPEAVESSVRSDTHQVRDSHHHGIWFPTANFCPGAYSRDDTTGGQG